MNYKEKIEEILQPMFQYEVQICTKCQHNFGEHYWGSGLDACRHEGCKCVADYGVYRTEVRNDSVPKSYVEQLTTLIEQAQKEHDDKVRREAVEGFVDSACENLVASSTEGLDKHMYEYFAPPVINYLRNYHDEYLNQTNKHLNQKEKTE